LRLQCRLALGHRFRHFPIFSVRLELSLIEPVV
jgi:hypothetical protein